jgi:hypothetical protein
MSIQRDIDGCQQDAQGQSFQPRESSVMKCLSVIRTAIPALIFAGAIMLAPAVSAEEAVANPLRPKASESQRARPEAKSESRPEKKTEAQAAKPKRERSEAQKRNDDMMRACGQEWRADKASLQAKGETWRNFLKDCRAKKKAEIRA